MPFAGPVGSPPVPDLPVPRPEHPRPDFRRPEWQNLNGVWEFRFDPEDRGRAERWEAPEVEFPDRILVPFPWESPAAWGEAARADDRFFYHPKAFREPVAEPGDPVLDGAWRRQHGEAPRQEIGWYRRRLRVPAAWRRPGLRVYLCVGAADWEAQVFLNGWPVGSHEGGYAPFSVDLTPFLRSDGDEDVLVIRVRDPQDHREQPGGKQHGWYERTSGIWQTVYLERRPEAHLTHLAVRPDLRGRRAFVEVGLSPVAGEYEVRVTARSPQGEAFAARTVCPGCERRTLELPLGPHPEPWSPEHPALYDLVVEVVNPGEPPEVDVVHSYFGLREVGFGTLPGTDVPCLTLNGEPFYVRAALHQSFHPAGVYAYVRDEVIADDLRFAKEVGLNALRVHIKVDDPRVYYWADRLGLAIVYDLPNVGGDERPSPRARRLWEETFRAALERDRNHPSILWWVLFNETWGLGRGYKDDPETQAWVASMVELCHRLDPTRPVEDNSPCLYDHVVTDINSWHFYINDYDRAREHVETAVRSTYPGSGWNFVPGRTQGRQPLINSEYGGIGAHMGDRDVSHCLKWLTALLRGAERVTGYVYTELTDVEWEHNGLLRYHRLPKAFPYDLRDVLGPDVLVVDAPPLVVGEAGARVVLPLAVSVFSPELRDGTGRLLWSVEGVDTAGRHVHGPRGDRPASWRRYRVTPWEPLEVPLPDRPGLYQVRLVLEGGDGRVVCRTYQDVLAGRVGGALPALEVSGFRAVHARGDYWVGQGPGSVAFELPPTGEVLVLEASAGVWEPRQTDPVTTPARVTVSVDGRRLGTYLLPDAPADALGVLSYAAGVPGAYGYLLRIPLPDGRPAGPVRVELAADEGGLALFGPTVGRYPLGPSLVSP
jgi:hypothetical protein